MGVGQTAAAIHNFPYGAYWLRVFGIVVWGIAIAMFLVFNFFFIMRFIRYPGQFKKMMLHPGQSTFLGCYPMGFATIINMIHFIWGSKAWIPVYVMWWIDVVLSLLCAWGLTFIMFTQHKRHIDTLVASFLLPIVTLVVAAATGGLIAPAQPIEVQPSTVIISFLIWANGVGVGITGIVIYVYRLLVSGLPPRNMAYSSLICLGPFGQSGFGIMCIAESFCEILKREGSNSVDAVHWGGIIVALFMVGYGTFWVVFGVMVTFYKPPTAFNMSFWALTFPLGTYVVAWYKLAELLDMTSFKVIGSFFGVLLMLNVLGCSIASIYYAVLRVDLFDQVKGETTPEEPSFHEAAALMDSHTGTDSSQYSKEGDAAV